MVVAKDEDSFWFKESLDDKGEWSKVIVMNTNFD
jgi:hypothetical protein